MINKQNLWFVTLFSLILVLGIYYVSIDDEVIKALKSDGSNNSSQNVMEITESDVLVSLEVEDDEEKQALMEEYQDILLDSSATAEEKNVAYENMQKLNNSIGMEQKLKEKLKKEFKLNSFIKINDNSISVTIASDSHDAASANNIIRSIQEEYTDEMYITIKYQK